MALWKYFCVLCEEDIEEWHPMGGRMKRGVCPSCMRLSVEQMHHLEDAKLTMEDVMSNGTDWSNLKAERESGTSVKLLAIKYGVTTAAIYARLKNGSTGAVTPKVNGRKASGTYASMIDELKDKRQRITEAIAALEALEAA